MYHNYIIKNTYLYNICKARDEGYVYGGGEAGGGGKFYY